MDIKYSHDNYQFLDSVYMYMNLQSKYMFVIMILDTFEIQMLPFLERIERVWYYE